MDRRILAVSILAGALLATGCSAEQPLPSSTRPTMAVTRPTSLPTAPGDVPEQLDDGSTMPPSPNTTLSTDAASRAAASDAAAEAMTLFARQDVDAQTWWSELVPLMSARAAQDYRYVDPANVPATRVTGAVKLLPQETPTVARVRVPTDAGVYLLVLSRTAAEPRWVVERFTPPESAGD